MKSERDIAKENVELFNQRLVSQRALSTSVTHKQTCQKWLEFLEDIPNSINGLNDFVEFRNARECGRDLIKHIKKKIQDLKQAIKLYDDAGI